MLLALTSVRAEAEPKSSEVTPKAVPSQAASVALSAEELRAISGGEEVKVDVLTHQSLNAAVSENSITAHTVESGDVSFAPNPLNFNGIGNFVVNPGNNNAIQGSLSVTILNAAPSP